MKTKKAKEYIFADTLRMEEYCQMHYGEYYSASDFSCNVTQLSKGLLQTNSICSPIRNVHLEVFKSNQTILYEEEANKNSVAFCWLRNGGDKQLPNTIISGHKMHRDSIAGFNRLNKTGGNIWDIVGAHTTLCCMSLKWDKLKETIHRLNAYNAYAILEECIGIDSEMSSSKQLKGLFDRHFKYGVTSSEAFYDLAVATLDEISDKNRLITARSDKTDLVEDLVKLLHDDSHILPPLRINDIVQYLDVDSSSLSEASKSCFGMSVMSLLESIRLEQLRKTFLNPNVPKGLKHFTKERNALYYGFKNWSKLEQLYYYTFKENPDNTIDRTSKVSVLVSGFGREVQL